jgi:hypothetical protein
MSGIRHGLQPTFMEGIPGPRFTHLDRPSPSEETEVDEPAPDNERELRQAIGGIGAIGEFPDYGTRAPSESRHEELDVDPGDSGWAD